MKTAIMVVIAMALVAVPVASAPIDLSSFTVDNSLNFPGGQGNGNWNVTGGGQRLFKP
jgi:hypothetical protein